MNFGLNDDQQMLRDTFARFFDSESTIARVRQANEAGGFDRALWRGLAELGTFAMRLPEEAGGLGLGTFDATLVLREAGRTLASGPIAEALMAARLLGQLNGDVELLAAVLDGGKLVTLALHDVAHKPKQWLAGGGHADAAVARKGDDVILVMLADTDRRIEPNLASSGIGEIDLGKAKQIVLASGKEALERYWAAVEECKLLVAATVNGLADEAVRLAAAYACEREAFGVKIGTFQAMSHPLANFHADIEAGRFLIWKVIHDIANGDNGAGARLPLALWWNAQAATRAAIQSLRTFGGYGLTTEYDIHLYNLRAKAIPLVHGDPQRLLEQAGRRLYGDEPWVTPEVGTVSIDFDLGEEATALAREVEDFFDRTLTPELRTKAHYSWDGHDPYVHQELAKANLLFPAWPKEKGGRGAPPYARHAAMEVWDKNGWTGHAASVSQMVAAIVDRFGSDEAKEKVLKPVLAGEAVCSLGYSEPGSGSDVFAAQCKAVPDGDGWRIDGTKMFTSGANLADFVLMLTRTNTEVPKHKGLTMFIVPLKSEGITVQPVYTFQDERTNITFYDNVKVPDAYRLGDVDGGVRTMSASLELEHGGGGFAKELLALRTAAEELCREIEYDGKPLIQDRLAQMRLARATAHYEMACMLSWHSLWSTGNRLNLPAVGPMSKLFGTEKFLEDASDLLDLTAPLSLSKRDGAAGFVNQCYRHAHGTTIYAGTSEVHRSMIAEKALGLPRSRG
ncbi:MAG TPA: acyl-CoA dehydrogenase [Novosphingobium sp.]